MLIGVGEATVFPVALSLLADLYPGPRLARTVSIFQASAGVGVMVGSVLAGLLAASLGWRTMFELFGTVGLTLVLLIAFTMRPTASTLVTDAEVPTSGRLLTAIGAILAEPGLAWLAVGYAASNMMLACLPTWAPAFLLRSHGVQLSEVGALVGPPAVLGGISGTILSGMFATGFASDPYRSTDGAVFSVVEGEGESIVGGQRLRWKARDVFVVPSWTDVTHRADGDAVLFSFSDRSAQEKLGLWRERRGRV